ncbi:hypothetical protein L7F22_004321 [Adiantum nelumboides]|nr:hypothetical protein [Adiantum nelumboides]
MVVPVVPMHPTMPQPPTNSPRVVSPAPGARVPIATCTPSSNAGSNTRKRKASDIWYANEVNVLLDLYEDKWISLNRGNFKAKDWTELAWDIQTRCAFAFTDTQCRNKWDNMKKTFIREKQKEACSGAESSRWEFYSRMEDLIGGTPKVSGLGDGFIGEYFVTPKVISLAEDEDMAAAEGEGGYGANEFTRLVHVETIPGRRHVETIPGSSLLREALPAAFDEDVVKNTTCKNVFGDTLQIHIDILENAPAVFQ